jgi:CheY-like chemotaxis protein
MTNVDNDEIIIKVISSMMKVMKYHIKFVDSQEIIKVISSVVTVMKTSSSS